MNFEITLLPFFGSSVHFTLRAPSAGHPGLAHRLHVPVDGLAGVHQILFAGFQILSGLFGRAGQILAGVQRNRASSAGEA